MSLQTFSANGKLLLTGEYLVLKGALALAVPTQLGQTMTVETVHTPSLQWNAYRPDGLWFSATLNPETLEVIQTDDPGKAQKLSEILHAVRQLNPSAFGPGLRFETRLDFNPEWGLGSSSTLIDNLAQWAGVDPYRLLKATFGGSGYDIACATAKSPIFYRLENEVPQVHPVAFNPPFAEQLYFVYQGKKQQSSKEVSNFKQRLKEMDFHEEIEAVSQISQTLPEVTELADFSRLMDLHEEIVGRCLDRQPIKVQFPDFEGSLKSLGAWGGDFLLAATPWPEDRVRSYFYQKGLDIIFKYNALYGSKLD